MRTPFGFPPRSHRSSSATVDLDREPEDCIPARGRATGPLPGGRTMAAMHPTRILFICIGNSCRSPMAEAMANRLGNGRIAAASAGLAPIDRVSPGTHRALEALGYPSAGLRCKGLDAVDLGEMDVIVSLVGRSGLAYLPGRSPARRIAWSIRDPYGDDDEVFLEVAQILERRVRGLVAELETELPAV